MNRDLFNNIGVLTTLAPAATGAGDWVDLRGYDSAAVLLSADATAAASALTLEQSDNASDAEAVPADDILGGPVAIEQGATTRYGYRGNSRYIRINATVTAGNVSAVVVVGHPHVSPAADPAAG